MSKADNDNLVKFVKYPHGNVVATSKNNQIMGTYYYTAFGTLRESTEDISNPFRYCGEYQDLSSGLIYLRNRYYDTSICRFISEDPIQDALNWYAYCGNNPVNFWDPTGQSKEGDELFSQSIREEIAIYGLMWSDAEVAYSLGIISIYEKRIRTTKCRK